MSRKSTITITIDDTQRQAAKLTLGDLRALGEMEAAATDAVSKVRVQVESIRRSLVRADPSFTLTASQLEDVLDEEDVKAAATAVLQHSSGRRSAPAGEPASP
jgi:hypothetical protein